MNQFKDLGISEDILRAITEMGYETPTAIQSESIPLIMQGRDVLGKSHTGTGKTAAFGIPAIEACEPSSRHPQVMIICPTRELVSQVALELRKFSKYREGIKIVPIYGGTPIDRQIQLLKRGCSILVGTPGRIMDHINRHTLKLHEVKMVVLDEADEMLNMGFKEDIEEILGEFPQDKHHQMILFSATWPEEILNITKQFQHDPYHVEIKSAQRTIDTVEQVYYEVPRGKKANALRVLLNHYEPERTMIFCNTKKMVDELSDEFTKHDIKVTAIHGDMKQDFRSRVMEQFKQGICPVLIASDVAARGIDVDDIDLVVNYDIPQDYEYYIHRVGRTGRAGKKGLAVTLIHGQRQRYQIRDLTRYTKTEISRRKLPSSKMMERANRNAYIAKVKELCDIGITEESLEVANALMAEGIALENLLSALISMSYKNELIDIEDDEVKKYASDFEAVTLKFSLGRMDGIQPGNIIAAVIEECDISKNAIGKIEVFKNFTLVSISADKVDIVLNNMQGAKVRKKEVQVELDQPPKRKNKQNDKKPNDKKASEKKGSEKESSKPKKERRNKQEATGRRARNRKEKSKEKTRSIRKSKKK